MKNMSIQGITGRFHRSEDPSERQYGSPRMRAVAKRAFEGLQPQRSERAFSAHVEERTQIPREVIERALSFAKEKRAEKTQLAKAEPMGFIEEPFEGGTLYFDANGKIELEIEGKTFTLSDYLQREPLHPSLQRYIDKYRNEMQRKAQASPKGIVYVDVAGTEVRGIQFQADGSVYVHMRALVGKGASKTVRLAINVDTGETLVVGTLRDKDHLPVFKREAGFLQRFVGQRGIAQMIGIVEVDDRKIYFLQPHYNARDLTHAIGSGTLTEKEKIAIAKDLMEGAAALELSHVVHRDIKTKNIFLHRDADGLHAVIADFGLASEKETEGGTVGTFQYWPPESRTKPGQTHKGDMWALGLCLQQMQPTSEPMQQLIKALLQEDPDRRLSGGQALAFLNTHVLA